MVCGTKTWSGLFYEDINPIEQKSLDSKLEVLNRVNDYLRKKDSKVKQVTASFSGEQKSIEIIRAGGEALTDIRPLIRFNVSVMLEKNGRKETGVYGIGGRQSEVLIPLYQQQLSQLFRWV